MAKSEWRGDQVKKNVLDAGLFGMNKVMAKCVMRAKMNHPGWKNITATAEGSIRIIEFAKKIGKFLIGKWGSRNVDYMIWLEIKHGSALRNAAAIEYPKLFKEMKRKIK